MVASSPALESAPAVATGALNPQGLGCSRGWADLGLYPWRPGLPAYAVGIVLSPAQPPLSRASAQATSKLLPGSSWVHTAAL